MWQAQSEKLKSYREALEAGRNKIRVDQLSQERASDFSLVLIISAFVETVIENEIC
jgi:hypothetical protein